MIRVSKNIDEILTKMIHLRIPVVDSLKTQNRFMLLTMSTFHLYPFNRLIRKAHENLDGIFYIVEGEVKVTNCGKIEKIIGKGHFLGL